MNTRRWLITLAACVVVLLVLAGVKYQHIQAAIAFGQSFPEPSATVQAMTVQLEPVEQRVNTIGEVLTPQQLMLRSELAGRIESVAMVSGQSVKKGQVLLQLDIRDDRARLEAAAARAKLAELKLKRAQRLLKSRTASQDDVDQAQAEFDIARASVTELKAIIDKKTLVAPFDAVVGLHHLEVGEYLDANTELVELVGEHGALWVDFNLPLSQGEVALGETVVIELPAGESRQQVSAQVIARSPGLSEMSRNRHYRAELQDGAVLPVNAVVNVSVSVASREGMRVPTTAVQRDPLGSYVFRLEKEGKAYRAQRQGVKLGAESAQWVSVTEGLQAGMLIATSGAFKLAHGMLAYVGTRPDGTVEVRASAAAPVEEASDE
ncbi:efflux RND transporter periplasmic adaptor subunit [Spongiibacter sp. KMU-158]|uniref:Efflux RND transporter periplasmic adaptor subunit n=1 Tax=Spongiibacter pelagi TaxID=2760804 RepID=A0A927GW82_9GAMM|nr:efflux RND transporter periplasmic adaptor subunit [Spongiibacter pelagi]MBD2859456.1 efflux RND transporter periplasmic adaptor subunit [Spongiibacter pelagi]